VRDIFYGIFLSYIVEEVCCTIFSHHEVALLQLYTRRSVDATQFGHNFRCSLREVCFLPKNISSCKGSPFRLGIWVLSQKKQTKLIINRLISKTTYKEYLPRSIGFSDSHEDVERTGGIILASTT